LRKLAGICFFTLCLTTLSCPAWAGDERFHPQGSPGRKLERGGANLLLGGIELVRHLGPRDEGQFLPPWIIGLGKGFYFTLRRTLVGLYEVITFPFPIPGDYLPVIEPEFVWEYPPAGDPPQTT
jgi:putative exosortase-associated protein (TIGR04073 family)